MVSVTEVGFAFVLVYIVWRPLHAEQAHASAEDTFCYYLAVSKRRNAGVKLSLGE